MRMASFRMLANEWQNGIFGHKIKMRGKGIAISLVPNRFAFFSDPLRRQYDPRRARITRHLALQYRHIDECLSDEQ